MGNLPVLVFYDTLKEIYSDVRGKCAASPASQQSAYTPSRAAGDVAA
jgi:hypothetical protein